MPHSPAPPLPPTTLAAVLRRTTPTTPKALVTDLAAAGYTWLRSGHAPDGGTVSVYAWDGLAGHHAAVYVRHGADGRVSLLLPGHALWPVVCELHATWPHAVAPAA